MLTAVELHGRGLALANRGRHAAARRLFHQALLRADPEAVVAIRIEISLAYSESELGTFAQGLDRLQIAAGRRGVPDHTRGLLFSQLGLLHMRAGDGRSALDALHRAEPLLDPQAWEARGTLALTAGNVHLQSRDSSAAISWLGRAAEDFGRALLPAARSKALHNLGYAHLLRGDLALAISLMDEAAVVLAAESPASRAVAAQDRAEALSAAGLPAEAAAALAEAVDAFARRRMAQRRAQSLLGLARVHLRTDPALAGRFAVRAARLFRARGSEVWAVRADAVAYAATTPDLDHPRPAPRAGRSTAPDPVAAGLLLAARLRRDRLGHEATSVTLHAARRALARDDAAQAARLLGRVRLRADSPLENRLLAHEVRAALEKNRGRAGAVQRRARVGLAELHEWQSAFGSLDLQSSLVGHGRTLALAGLRVAIGSGRPDAVFEWSERARTLSGRVVPVRPAADERSAARLADLRRAQADVAAAETARRPVAPLLDRVARLRREIREAAWRESGSGAVSEVTSTADVQAALAPADGVLLAHLHIDGALHLLTVEPGSVRVQPLGPAAAATDLLPGLAADLEMSAHRLPRELRAVVRRSLDRRLAALSELLVGPVRDRVAGRPVVLVPTAVLAGLPWTLLPDLAAGVLTLPRSATSWIAQRDRWAARAAGFVAGPRVARAHEEVQAAAAHWPGAEVLAGAGATASAVSALAGQVDVLHVAAHGRHAVDNPLFSGLELSDGAWFGYDIDGLRAVPRTVVLSACELGRSTTRWGEESIGMAVAWLHAGASVVIASPTVVGDDIACEVLARWHRELVGGANPATALALAQRQVDGPSPFQSYGAGW